MKRLSVRILTIQKPPYSPDWTSWSSSEERGESFTSRSSILNWVAVTSGYKHLTLLKPTPLRDLSQSALITRLMVIINLGEDLDVVQDRKKVLLSVTHQNQGIGLCVLVVNLFGVERTQFLVQGLTL